MMKRLTGTWYSERGSRLELRVTINGHIEGSYLRPPGKSAGSFSLVGMTDPADIDGNRCFAFIVIWNNGQVNQHSITAWSGQYRFVKGEEILDTTWLLTKETHVEEDWTSTLVGTDIFHRAPPASHA